MIRWLRNFFDYRSKKQTKAAERALMDGIFEDIYKNRKRVYRISFCRGLFFGFGSVLGGTILIAITLWLLAQMVDIPGGVGDFVQKVIDTIQK